MPKRVPCATRDPSVARTAGYRRGCENGRTAQAAAESSPDAGSPDRLASRRDKSRSMYPVFVLSAEAASALPR